MGVVNVPYFYFGHVDGEISIFCPKASYCQNNEQKNVEMWNQNNVFKKSIYNNHVSIMEIAFKATLSRNPQPIRSKA